MMQTKLMIPGPVDITEEVRTSMSVASMPHYGRDWLRLFGETQEMLKQVFGTRHDIYLMGGPGTMALEAAMSSALEPGDKILVAINGFFGERLLAVAESAGLNPLVVQADLGKPVLPQAVAAALREHPDAKALVVVHHETATGVLNPVREIVEVGHAEGILTIVDAVSSLGGVPLPVDAWDVDLCVSVANKALGTPPGLSLISISPQAWEAISQRKASRGWYLDLKTWRWYAENWGDWHPTPATMPTSNLYALNRSLERLLACGLEVRYQAYQAAACAVRAGLVALGFSLFVEEATYASPLATAFEMREGVDAEALKPWLVEHAGIVISGGIGELRGRILRVGHMGLARKRDYVVAFLLAVEDYLRIELGLALPAGQSLAMLDDLEL